MKVVVFWRNQLIMVAVRNAAGEDRMIDKFAKNVILRAATVAESWAKFYGCSVEFVDAPPTPEREEVEK